MNKKLLFFIALFITSFSFTFSETDYFIPNKEGGGVFMKWDSNWYKEESLSDEGIFSIFGVLYALITNQRINGNEYIIIEEYKDKQEFNFSFIRINTIPEYVIYLYLLNNGNIKNYKLTFSEIFSNSKGKNIKMIYEINLADTCSEIVWELLDSLDIGLSGNNSLLFRVYYQTLQLAFSCKIAYIQLAVSYIFCYNSQ